VNFLEYRRDFASINATKDPERRNPKKTVETQWEQTGSLLVGKP
jgi:hypothetical protein